MRKGDHAAKQCTQFSEGSGESVGERKERSLGCPGPPSLEQRFVPPHFTGADNRRKSSGAVLTG